MIEVFNQPLCPTASLQRGPRINGNDVRGLLFTLAAPHANDQAERSSEGNRH